MSKGQPPGITIERASRVAESDAIQQALNVASDAVSRHDLDDSPPTPPATAPAVRSERENSHPFGIG